VAKRAGIRFQKRKGNGTPVSAQRRSGADHITGDDRRGAKRWVQHNRAFGSFKKGSEALPKRGKPKNVRVPEIEKGPVRGQSGGGRRTSFGKDCIQKSSPERGTGEEVTASHPRGVRPERIVSSRGRPRAGSCRACTRRAPNTEGSFGEGELAARGRVENSLLLEKPHREMRR